MQVVILATARNLIKLGRRKNYHIEGKNEKTPKSNRVLKIRINNPIYGFAI